MWAHLDELRHLQRNEDGLREVTRSRLRDLLTMLGSVPFYRSSGPGWLDSSEDLPHSLDDLISRLREFPLLTKQDLQDTGEQLQAPDPGRAARKTTGGSTGQPVTILKSAEGVARERAASWLAHEWYGIEPADRAVRLWGEPQTSGRSLRYRLADLAMNRKRLSAFGVDDRRMADYWRLLAQYRPRYLYGYAGMLEALARHILHRQLDSEQIGLVAVISTAEPLTEVRRTVIRNAFRVPVQNEYGCGEVGPIAYECPEGSLHIMSQNILLEVLRPDGSPADPGENGRIVITDLNNHVMPLVRYVVGDTAAPGSACGCGRAFPVLQSVAGRTYDFLEDSDGRRYHGEAVMYVVEDLGPTRKAIRGFQIVQREAGLAVMRLMVRDGIDQDALAARLEEAFLQRLGRLELQVEFVERIEAQASGKTPLIVREPFQEESRQQDQEMVF